MIGVAVGLGNVWRFPYMVERFGGAAFVLFYVLAAALIGIPALIAEWTLGRSTRRGTVGAFERAGLPGGRLIGWLFFVGVGFATAYYSNVIGWVVYHGLGEAAGILAFETAPSRVLPPETGFDPGSLGLQLACTALVILGCAAVLLRGLRAGIERASRLITPLLFLILLLLIARSLTLPGALDGLRWYVLKFEPGSLSAAAALAALGQVVFSIALGGTFMVVYGSYLRPTDDLEVGAAWTVAGDTLAGLLAGLAIFPAVFALGLEPGSGPGLLFFTLPRVFLELPGGRLFGALFFLALAGAAYLSAVAAFEVLIAALTDNTRLSRRGATWLVAGAVMVLAVPPMINMQIFVPWDLTFGSGFQTLGALTAAVTVGWAMDRGRVLQQLTRVSERRARVLYLWVRFVIPGAILAVGIWWTLTDLLGVVGGV